MENSTTTNAFHFDEPKYLKLHNNKVKTHAVTIGINSVF